MGVGTVTMKMVAARSACASVVKVRWRASASSAASTSRV